LQNKGYQFLHQNFSTKIGEIDLVCLDQGTVVFVEVKYRQNVDFGQPYEAVDTHKLQKIIQVGYQYLQQYHPDKPFRIDIVSLDGELDHPHIHHYENISL
jgi:putative endonuclease